MRALCRDCFARWAADGRRACPECGSARILVHRELDELSTAHLDCDAFYAAVEIRDDPSLAEHPLIIGGGRRGVVSTCCYKARTFGVRSAMPMFQARRLCPQAVVRPPDMAKYAREARRIREAMRALTPAVEPLSIDEAFLDLSGTAAVHRQPPAATLARLAADIEREIGITVSIGLSYNKFLAKVASDLDKPRGFAVIGRAEARDFLAPRPVTLIFGIGKVQADRLARDGITTIAHLQALDEGELVRRYGRIGTHLARCARGEDGRTVEAESEAKGLSAETTFDDDIADAERLRAILWRLCEKLSRRLKTAGVTGRTVVLKLKTADFRLLTRSRTLGQPTQLAEILFREGEALLLREVGRRRYRLLGIGVHDLNEAGSGAVEGDLFAASERRTAEVERAIDAVRARFGDSAIGKGRGFKPPPRRRPEPADR